MARFQDKALVNELERVNITPVIMGTYTQLYLPIVSSSYLSYSLVQTQELL